MGSSASSLCTFLPTLWPFGRLRSGLPCRVRSLGVGFPEFTRSFNHSFPWKLQSPPYSHLLYRLSYRGTKGLYHGARRLSGL